MGHLGLGKTDCPTHIVYYGYSDSAMCDNNAQEGYGVDEEDETRIVRPRLDGCLGTARH